MRKSDVPDTVSYGALFLALKSQLAENASLSKETATLLDTLLKKQMSTLKQTESTYDETSHSSRNLDPDCSAW